MSELTSPACDTTSTATLNRTASPHRRDCGRDRTRRRAPRRHIERDAPARPSDEGNGQQGRRTSELNGSVDLSEP